MKRKTISHAFTLIEILVVLIIVAIITSVAVLAFGNFGRGRREKIIVNQFVRTIIVAEQQAILTPAVLGLGITNRGYHFFQYEISSTTKKGHWQPLRDDVLSNAEAFQNVFDANIKSISSAESKNINDKKLEILFLPTGFVTPFVLELKAKDHTFVVMMKNNGVVKVE